ncbi:testin gene [Rattus norvegicus]|uniref:Testin-2 n=2 Tax=Rattus norvegicus TaxID=10116 RepID=TEST2_RAT|nr:testin-2 precursor [Rattus norvegicus]XP_038951362.1 testin-2 isoform X1 [Rattus norvegicus]P15242.2 RecName: Full=Testin-2; AltName: Full=CMB-23; Contains: RecName: Full=Testin-1; AltName: Full=CMB-22; Flags: Precursor [Rattus norvegicus]AAC52162.1 testin [Rattus norvegicus]EDL93860.1 testin gene [Rattus norvegicus]|eukprot:NP_775155.1 testin-2 precursor [Rattus norvegicus]
MIAVLFLAILCLEVDSTAPTPDPSLDVEWNEWRTKHGKTYNMNEERLKRAVWEKNFKMIELHNWEYLEGRHDFTMAMNAFGDLTNIEFVKMMTGFQRQKIKKTHIFQDHQFLYVPKRVDWRQLGYVTPVKNQGHCASSWAFSATGSLEGQMFRKTERLIPLSEQNLLDCMGSNVTHGCSGGFMQYAFQYVKDNGGLATEESYPYRGQGRECRYHAENSAANVRDFVQIPGSEEALMKAVAKVGPISVAVDASHGSFQFYGSGIYYEPQCKRVHLNHAVLVVGYGFEGEESDGNSFWLVKNSWGEEWGMKGYMKLAKDWSNHCGIATYSTYPIV